MKLEYIYSFAEYKAINLARQHRAKFTQVRNWLYWGLVIANIAVSLRYIYIFYQGQVSFSWLMLANLGVAIAIVAYRYIFLPFLVRRYFSQQMLKGKTIKVHVTEQGIETVTDNISGQYGWKIFIGANEEPDHFVIWVNKLQAISIPKYAFKSDELVDEFRKAIVKNVENHQLQT
ncbi:hypothetical protein MNBD_ALPHA11-1736 [hydrothermal vent metagenome]|uniref:YcxB-like C-terminal domain-containing protein n=1 Tax=hydrothermal vent metagenome TaxID=652676 RepID=A0A3B0U991_9ZZZZ